MPADPLRRAGRDDVGPVLDRAAQEARRPERVVHHQRHAVGVGDVGDPLEVRDVEARIADRLQVDRLRVRVDQAFDRVGVVAVGDVDVEAAAREGVLELIVGPAVEVARGDDVVAVLTEGVEGQKLGGLPAGGGDGRDAAFERGHPPLEDVVRRVHDAAVDVAELFEGEEVGPVLRIVEGVGGGRVDGHGPGVGGRVRLLSRMELAGFTAGRLGGVGPLGFLRVVLSVLGTHRKIGSLDEEDASAHPEEPRTGPEGAPLCADATGDKRKIPSRQESRWGSATKRVAGPTHLSSTAVEAGWGTFPSGVPTAVARASSGLLPSPFWMNVALPVM